MSNKTNLVKAQLQELDAKFENPINPARSISVQFNPETLKVTFANQVSSPNGAGDQNGPAAQQFVGMGTTKLSLQLWFDVTALPDSQTQVDDVRKLTQKVAYFITPRKTEGRPPKFIPPAVRFLWGTFQFDGIMDSLEESLEFFSPDGRPLRASMTLSLSQQRITEYAFGKRGDQTGDQATGQRPLTQAQSGDTLQGMAASQGKGDDWKAIAAANNIENPRLLPPGQLIDMDAASARSGS